MHSIQHSFAVKMANAVSLKLGIHIFFLLLLFARERVSGQQRCSGLVRASMQRLGGRASSARASDVQNIRSAGDIRSAGERLPFFNLLQSTERLLNIIWRKYKRSKLKFGLSSPLASHFLPLSNFDHQLQTE